MVHRIAIQVINQDEMVPTFPPHYSYSFLLFPFRPEGFLFLAEYLEQTNQVETARALFIKTIHGIGQGVLDVLVRYCAFEQRQRQHNHVLQTLDAQLEHFPVQHQRVLIMWKAKFLAYVSSIEIFACK